MVDKGGTVHILQLALQRIQQPNSNSNGTTIGKTATIAPPPSSGPSLPAATVHLSHPLRKTGLVGSIEKSRQWPEMEDRRNSYGFSQLPSHLDNPNNFRLSTITITVTSEFCPGIPSVLTESRSNHSLLPRRQKGCSHRWRREWPCSAVHPSHRWCAARNHSSLTSTLRRYAKSLALTGIFANLDSFFGVALAGPASLLVALLLTPQTDHSLS